MIAVAAPADLRAAPGPLAAFVVLTADSSLSCDDLRAHVKDSLANYKIPRSVNILDEMPRNATGKIMKRELPQQLS